MFKQKCQCVPTQMGIQYVLALGIFNVLHEWHDQRCAWPCVCVCALAFWSQGIIGSVQESACVVDSQRRAVQVLRVLSAWHQSWHFPLPRHRSLFSSPFSLCLSCCCLSSTRDFQFWPLKSAICHLSFYFLASLIDDVFASSVCLLCNGKHLKGDVIRDDSNQLVYLELRL